MTILRVTSSLIAIMHMAVVFESVNKVLFHFLLTLLLPLEAVGYDFSLLDIIDSVQDWTNSEGNF